MNYLKMQTVFRMIVQKVMAENGIDAFVNPENTLPPFKLGGADEPGVNVAAGHELLHRIHRAARRSRDRGACRVHSDASSSRSGC